MPLKNWIGDIYTDSPSSEGDTQISMKAMLAACIEEAFRIAVCDSLLPETSDERRVLIHADLHAITSEEWAEIDPNALRRNICNRLLGYGGWDIRGVYSGNASAEEVFAASFPKGGINPIDQFMRDAFPAGSVEGLEASDG